MNQLHGTVSKVAAGTPFSVLEIDLANGGHIAGVDLTFSQDSGFAAGDKVVAYFDELDVILAKSFTGTSTVKNVLTGKVSRADEGSVLTKVSLDYNGSTVAALVRTTSWKSLGLSKGSEVTWLVKATRVSAGKP